MQTKVGRNDLCPCGSGKKYKKCCLYEAATTAPVHPAHAVDQQLVTRILEFARRTKGKAWIQDAWDDYQDESGTIVESDNWFWTCLAFHYAGRDDQAPTALEQFLASRPSLTPMEKTLVRAHQTIRISIFSVEDVRPGEAVLLEDRLCSGRFWVMERSMARTEFKHLVVLGRLGQVDDDSILLGMNVHPLPPAQAERVCAHMRDLLGRRGQEPSPEGLRQPELVMEMTDYWRFELEDRRPPQLVNNDGEEICWIRDRYTFPADSEGPLRHSLSGMEGVHWQSDETGGWVNAESISVGNFRFQKGALIVESNSIGRADRLGSALLGLGVSGLKRARRDRTAQAEMLRKKASSAPAPSGPEIDAFMQNFRRQWAEKWVDENLPALQGRTPRQAAADAEGRRQVEALLRDFEFREARLPPAQAFDMNEIRKELGLPVR